MAETIKFQLAVPFVAVLTFAGCTTSPWHEDLMSNDQLVRATCPQLAVEQQRVAENAKHAGEASSIGMFGTALLGALEVMTSTATKTPIDTNNSATIDSAGLADEHSKQASQLEGRRNMIAMLRSKKGCT